MSINRQWTRQVLSQAGASSQATSARRMRRNRKAVLWPRHPLILVSRNHFITHTIRNKNGRDTKTPRKIVPVLDKPERKRPTLRKNLVEDGLDDSIYETTSA